MATSTPNFNTAIPAKIMTPDRVSTRLGDLGVLRWDADGRHRRDGSGASDVPAGRRGVPQRVPAASLEALRVGLDEVRRRRASNKVVIFDDLMDSNSLFLTGNTDTVYALAILDLDRDGPTVVEIPPGCGPGTVDDAWFRFVIDMGAPGPDRGEGGKYLILPPGLRRRGARRLLHRALAELRQLDRAARLPRRRQARRRRHRCSATASRSTPSIAGDDPPAMEFINASGKVFNTIHANNVEFYDELHAVIDREPVELIDPETRGLMASIGIRKGQAVRARRRTAGDPRSTPPPSPTPPPGPCSSTPRTRTTTCTRAATGSAASSAATTSSCSTASGTCATSTPAPPSSTWQRSTHRRWR